MMTPEQIKEAGFTVEQYVPIVAGDLKSRLASIDARLTLLAWLVVANLVITAALMVWRIVAHD